MSPTPLPLTQTDHLPPAAWLGFAVSPGKNSIYAVRVCMDCEDKAEAEALAAKHNLPVTHGLCQIHYQKRTDALLGETTQKA